MEDEECKFPGNNVKQNFVTRPFQCFSAQFFDKKFNQGNLGSMGCFDIVYNSQLIWTKFMKIGDFRTVFIFFNNSIIGLVISRYNDS